MPLQAVKTSGKKIIFSFKIFNNDCDNVYLVNELYINLVFDKCATKDRAFHLQRQSYNRHTCKAPGESVHSSSRLLDRVPASTNGQTFCFSQTPPHDHRALSWFYRSGTAI